MDYCKTCTQILRGHKRKTVMLQCSKCDIGLALGLKAFCGANWAEHETDKTEYYSLLSQLETTLSFNFVEKQKTTHCGSFNL